MVTQSPVPGSNIHTDVLFHTDRERVVLCRWIINPRKKGITDPFLFHKQQKAALWFNPFLSGPCLAGLSPGAHPELRLPKKRSVQNLGFQPVLFCSKETKKKIQGKAGAERSVPDGSRFAAARNKSGSGINQWQPGGMSGPRSHREPRGGNGGNGGREG